jgi:hypothetical protein
MGERIPTKDYSLDETGKLTVQDGEIDVNTTEGQVHLHVATTGQTIILQEVIPVSSDSTKD